jgi:GMP synthase (glutamine-hydrolysing)
MEARIIIFDLGSQYTQLIKRKLEEQGISAKIIKKFSQINLSTMPQGLILSGSPDSLNSNSKDSCQELLHWIDSNNVPVLGICYGMHLLVNFFGGIVRSNSSREYGKSVISWNKSQHNRCVELFSQPFDSQVVWMSHADSLSKLPNKFSVLATSQSCVPAIVAHQSLPIVALQFHPEVYHSEKGDLLLKDFACKVCKIRPVKTSEFDISLLLEKIRTQVGNKKVLLGFSGGIDSAVLCRLLNLALPKEQVTSLYIDHGFMRANENYDVIDYFKGEGISIEVVRESERFFSGLKEVYDPEKKRKIIGSLFVDVFQDYAASQGFFSFLAQGTLYPDVIESSADGEKKQVIKSHHNVGGLSKNLGLELVEPFRKMFKDQVRALGLQLGMPYHVVFRHPFPGPGLAIRIPGAVDEEKVATLRQADEIYIKTLKDSGYYSKIWQAGAFLLPVKSVGVMGDQRSYEWTCVLRAVEGVDGMTAAVSSLPMSLLCAIAQDIVQRVRKINRVLYDITTKPPATIEWE